MKSILLTAWAGLLWAVAASSSMAQGMPESAAPTAFTATPANAATLDGYRGGTYVETNNDMTLSGTTASNTANHVVTGNNTIDAGSFANMSGLPLVIQNTGANVLIQNATIVHVEMQ